LDARQELDQLRKLKRLNELEAKASGNFRSAPLGGYESAGERDIRISNAQQNPKRFIDYASDVVKAAKGDKSLPDYDETPFILKGAKPNPADPTPDDEVSIKNVIATARGNTLGEANIFKEQFPNADVDFEEKSGLPVVYLDGRTPTTKDKGKPYYLNKSGLSPADVVSGAQEAAIEAGMSIPAARLLKFAGAAGRVLGAGVGAGTASIAQDKMSQALGSDLPVDQKRAAILSVFGAGGEVATPIIEKAIRGFYRSNKFVRDGVLTPEGANHIKEQFGADPKLFENPEFIKVFEDNANVAADINAASRAAQAETLPVPVRTSKGDVSQDVLEQGKEYDIERGARGSDAAQVAGQFRQDQARDIQANIDVLKQRAGGQVTRKGEGVAIVVNDLMAKKAAEKDIVNAAYEAARDTKASIPVQALSDLRKSAAESLRSYDINAKGMERLRERLSELDRMQVLEKLNNPRVQIRALEDWRKRIVTMAGQDQVEQSALNILKRQYEGFLDGAIDNALIQGNPQAIEMWRQARHANRVFKEKFSDNQIVDTLIRKDLSPEEGANYLLGAGKMGGKQGVLGALKKVKEIVGPSEWNALREETLLKMTQAKPGKEFSRQDIVTAIENMERSNPSMYEFMFDNEERRILTQIKNVSRFTQTPNKARDPGSAMPIIRAFVSTFGDFGRLTSAVADNFAIKGVSDRLAEGSARSMGTNTLKVKKLIPAGTLGGVSAGTASQFVEGQESQ
jgi:hypothetical protein